MKTKLLAHRILAVTISLLMVMAYTPVGAFAEAEGDSQDEISVGEEQAAHENSQTTDNSETPETVTEAEQKPADTAQTSVAETETTDSKPADTNGNDIQTEYEEETNGVADNVSNAGNTNSSDQNDETVSDPESPAATELKTDEAVSQSVSNPAEERATLSVGKQVHAASYGHDSDVSTNDEDNESVSSAEMPAIVYLVAVIFKGIKKASLISSKYKLTFDGITFYRDGDRYSYYADRVSFTKNGASILYDKHNNVILRWLFGGHRFDEEGNDIYTILDLDTARQSHTHISDYTFKGSKNQNFDFTLSWDDEEYNEDDPSQYLLIAGVSVTENKYKKAGSAASTVRDYSPATGDYQQVGLLGIMMCLSLLGALLIVLTRRIRRA